MINFIDFEVFAHNWLCVIVNPERNEETVIVDDADKLAKFYEEHKDEIFCGYNINYYDQFIFKAILCGFSPKKVNDWIIVKGKSGWQYSSMFYKIP